MKNYKFVISKPVAPEFVVWKLTRRILRTPFFTIGFMRLVEPSIKAKLKVTKVTKGEPI